MCIIISIGIFYYQIHCSKISVLQCRVETERVLSLSEAVKDTHILYHALATVKYFAACLQANVSAQSNAEEPSPPTSFVEVDTFAPAQKNETQLHFQRTTYSAGRKQKMVPLV